MGRAALLALAVVAILILPGVGLAQEATIGGTVTDSTSGVLPGVAVRAVHEATGTQFETFTDDRGVFRIPVRIGVYRIIAELSGFAILERTGLEVLVGQQLIVEPRVEALCGGGDRDGDRGSAARQRRLLSAGREHRFATDVGASGERAELPGSGDAGARLPREPHRSRRLAGDAWDRAAQRRRHAGHQQLLWRLQPAAELRPGRHCRVPVLGPLRRDPGPLVGRASERHHEIGHQHAVGLGVGLFPARRPQRGGFHPAPSAAVLESAGQHDVRRAVSARPPALLLQRTNSSASRRPSRTTRPIRASTSI